MPAWQAPGYAAAALQGNGGAPSAAHPGAAEHVQRLLLEGKKAEALRCPRQMPDSAHEATSCMLCPVPAALSTPFLFVAIESTHKQQHPAKPVG